MSGNVLEHPIVIPAGIEGQDMPLGTLIDCRNYQATPPTPRFLQDPEPDPEDNIETIPIRTLKYDFSHVRDTKDKEQTLSISLSVQVRIMIGPKSLNLTVGSVAYSSKYNSKLEEEHIQVVYYREDQVKRLLPAPAEEARIKSKFALSGEETHIVTEVVYGVHVIADVLIKTSKTTKMSNKSAMGLGILIIGPISAGIEAALKAVLDKTPDGVKVDINVKSTHPGVIGQVTTATQLFAKLKELDKIQTSELKPVKLFCVPIKQFLPDTSPPDVIVPLIPDFVLAPLNDMMAALRDFQKYNKVDEDGEEIDPPELVPSTHYVKMIMAADYRLHIILEDSANPITAEAEGKQTSWNGKAEDLYQKGKTLIENLTTTTTVALILAQLEEYKDRFKIEELHAEIKEFILSGKEQLSLINADDVDEYTEAHFVGSQARLNEELAELRPPVYVILETDRKEETPPSGIFLAIYNLSAKMPAFVKMPNASTEFSLTLKTPALEKKFTDFKEMMIVLDILTASSGVSGGPASRWYQALASQQDIPLPLTKDEYDTKFFQFFTDYLDKYQDVDIFPTFMSLKSHLLNPPEPLNSETVIICLPVPSFTPLTEAALAFTKLHTLLKGLPGYQFIVGTFDLGSEDAPLLTLFKGGNLLTVCLDWLDFLRLHHTLENATGPPSQIDFSTLNTSISTFYPTRTQFYVELRQRFAFSLHQKPTLVHHPKVLELADPTHKIQIDTALQVASAYLTIDNQEHAMATVLTKKLLQLQPSYTNRLEGIGWSPSEEIFHHSELFGENSRSLVRKVYLDLLFGSSTLLTNLGAFIHTIDFCVQAYRAAEPFGKEEVAQFDQVMAMVNAGFLNQFNTIHPPYVDTVRDLLATSPITVEKVEEALIHVQNYLLLHENFATIDGVSHLQSILSILPPIVEEVSPTENLRRLLRWDESSQVAFNKIVRTFVMQVVNVESQIPEVVVWLDNRLILKIVNQLSKISYPKWHQVISDAFRGFVDILDYPSLQRIVEGLKDPGLNIIELKEHHFIWSNPPFGRMILEAITADEGGADYSKAFFEAVVDRKGQDDDPEQYVNIPPYIPIRIARRLREHLHPDPEEGKKEGGRVLRRRQWVEKIF